MAPFDNGPVTFRLTGRQRSVYASLAVKSLAMATLYENALRALRGEPVASKYHGSGGPDG